MNVEDIKHLIGDDDIVFLSYSGYLSQSLIVGMVEVIEQEASDSKLTMKVSHNIFTVFIELSQNILNYAKTIDEKDEDENAKKSQGFIVITRDEKQSYCIHSQNIISMHDKEYISKVLNEIQSLTQGEIKKKYKELRKSGENTHKKGGGIGFYEIARKCDNIEFDFREINANKYYFNIKTTIITK